MNDDLFSGAFRLVSGLVKDFLVDIVYGMVCYAIGWLFLRIVSLGRTPGATLAEGVSQSYDTEDDWVSILGCLICLGIFMKLYF